MKYYKNELFLFATQIRFLEEWKKIDDLLLFVITNPEFK